MVNVMLDELAGEQQKETRNKHLDAACEHAVAAVAHRALDLGGGDALARHARARRRRPVQPRADDLRVPCFDGHTS